MRIVQITDLHIGREGEDTRGIDVRKNFLDIVAAAQSCQPDHLVLSGDLCYREGERGIYEWLKPHLDELQISYDIISGNHDDPVLMAEIFDRQHQLDHGELFFAKTLHACPFLFLDTTKGVLSVRQLEWLGQQLDVGQKDLIIFMHHPPVFAGVPFMDENHALQNMKEVQALFFNYPFNITIFTGHYHVEKTIRQKNLLVHITPSCFIQIDQYSRSFKVDHYRIGLREIVFEDGRLMNTVKYL